MLGTSLKLNEEINELKNIICKRFGACAIENMSGEEFELLKMSLKIINDSQELIVKQAETINGIDQKLNMLLNRKGIER